MIAYLDGVAHDGHLVQGGLPVEQHHVSVAHVPLYDISYGQTGSCTLTVGVLCVWGWG
jgi:hypothetical protein